MRYAVIPLVIILILAVLGACNGDDGTTEPTGTPEPTDQQTAETREPVTVTIGNLTDKTGPASQSMSYIDMALKDAVNYYNDNNLIPDVVLKLVEYDTQYEPSRYRPGYEWLREKGADVLTSFLPTAPEVLRPWVEEDQMVFFTANAEREFIYPPGYTFAWANLWEESAYTQLKWIAENHWGYQTNGPAKIGGAGWNDGGTNILFRAFKEYAEAHPDQFDWVGGYLTDFSFTWGTEVERLKDCDYVYVPMIMHVFVREWTNAGYETTFLASEPHTTFLGLVKSAGLMDEIDGALFAMNLPWWGEGAEEETPIVDELLAAYHAGSEENIKNTGRSYITAGIYAQLCEIIKITAAAVGPENVDSAAIYEATENFQYDLISRPNFLDFSPEKRHGYNYFVMAEADGETGSLVTISDWIPVVREP